MSTYLFTIYQPDEPLPPADLERVSRDVDALEQEMRAAGVWVFGGGLHPATTATVLTATAGEVLLTDGPYTEGKEHVGGVTVVEAADLDAALGWAEKTATVIGLPVEVRPFQG